MPCDKSLKPVAYFNGIYYAAGQNKGLLLQCLLPKSDQAKQIIFLYFWTPQKWQDFGNMCLLIVWFNSICLSLHQYKHCALDKNRQLLINKD